jgi:SAM-dependent methyltransferase
MRRTAENHERYFVPSIGAPVAADLVKAASLRPGERVLDAACGTGVVTKLAAKRVAPGGTLAGLDPNPAMLAVARATTRSDVSIDWHEAPAEDLPFPDESFDAVLCGMGLQFFADREAGLREFHRRFGAPRRTLRRHVAGIATSRGVPVAIRLEHAAGGRGGAGR